MKMNKKILIVDDEAGLVETVRDRLEFNGYDVVTAPDGDVGLDMFELEKPDLILLDILMPRLNGYAFLKMLKSRSSGADVPVIISTARGDVMDAFKTEGIAGFLVKPYDLDELLKMIGVIFRLKNGAAPRQKAAQKHDTPQPQSPPVREEPPDQPPAGPVAEDTSPPESSQDRLKPKILIIDDEVDFVDGLKERLVFEGYDVAVAANGHDGVAMVKRMNPDVVLMDVMMPKMDGYLASRLIKFDEKYRRIPIIMMTARNLNTDRELGFASGADGYITKPVDFALLLGLIKEQLEKKG